MVVVLQMGPKKRMRSRASCRSMLLQGCCNLSPPACSPPPFSTLSKRVERCLAESDASSSAPVVIYVSKMVAVPVSVLPRCAFATAISCVRAVMMSIFCQGGDWEQPARGGALLTHVRIKW